MEIFLAILGSSLLSTVVTAIFAFVQGRKQDTLKYIGEERTKWREKIRKIAEDIETCRYGGVDEKNIDIYLNQLQMNINTYGKFDKSDYIHDGHIWEVIEVIQNADSEDVFEANKKLLLNYISLMLKEDWERSKEEVRGFSNVLKCILLNIIIFTFLGLYYFVVLNIENIMMYLQLVTVNILCVLLVRFRFVNKTFEFVNVHNPIKIKEIRKKENKIWNYAIRAIIVYVIYLVILFIMLHVTLPGIVVDNMKYKIYDDEIFLYTNLDNRFVSNIEKELVKDLNMKVHIIYDKNEINEWNEERIGEIDKKLRNVVNTQTLFCYVLIWFLLYVGTIYSSILIDIPNRDKKNRQLKEYIGYMKYLTVTDYLKEISEEEKILEEILKLEDVQLECENAEVLLGVAYRLLRGILQQLESNYNNSKIIVENLDGIHALNNLSDAISIIKDCMAKLEKLPKKNATLKKQQIFEVKECIMQLRKKGDIYSNS